MSSRSVARVFWRAALLAGIAAAAVWWRDGWRDLWTTPERLEGAWRVVDGDSLEMSGRRLRLDGIDAPELAQICARAAAPYPCGRVARDRLADLAAAGPLACTGSRRDRYDRLLVTCRAGGRDLGAEMVRAGWAVSYGGYRAEEAEARREKRGLWSGAFESPDEWRRDHRRAEEF